MGTLHLMTVVGLEFQFLIDVVINLDITLSYYFMMPILAVPIAVVKGKLWFIKQGPHMTMINNFLPTSCKQS